MSIEDKVIKSIHVYQTVINMWKYRIVYNDDKVIDTHVSGDYDSYDDLLVGLDEEIVHHGDMRH